jgi:hypothetical protein
VWLAEDGSCVNGHPSASVSNVYEATPPAQPAAPVRKPMKTWVIVLLVLVGLSIPLCGIVTAISVPVFLNASSNAELKSCQANQRTILGAAATFQVMNDDVDLPGDFESLMATLVPDLLKAEPKCPAGGSYTFDPNDGEPIVECSVHGGIDSY